MGHFTASSLGLPGLPLVIIKHPLAGITKDAIIKKAEAIVEATIYVLTQSEEVLDLEFRKKEYPLPTGVCPMTKPGI